MRALVILLWSVTLSSATQLRLTTIYLPVYFHADTDVNIMETAVPFATAYASPEASLAALGKPFVPHHDTSWQSAGDANMVTVYGIALKSGQMENSPDYLMTIDVTAAKQPDGMPFTLEEVIEATKRCATLNYPTS